MELYSPTCLLFVLVFNRTICRMLELVMSETMSATRFHTRSRAPHSMWYCLRRIPSQHSLPNSFCLHLPFLIHTNTSHRHTKNQIRITAFVAKFLKTLHFNVYLNGLYVCEFY